MQRIQIRVTLTAALGAALLLAPSAASAQDDEVDGVRAVVKHGTLQVKGGVAPREDALRGELFGSQLG